MQIKTGKKKHNRCTDQLFKKHPKQIIYQRNIN